MPAQNAKTKEIAKETLSCISDNSACVKELQPDTIPKKEDTENPEIDENDINGNVTCEQLSSRTTNNQLNHVVSSISFENKNKKWLIPKSDSLVSGQSSNTEGCLKCHQVKESGCKCNPTCSKDFMCQKEINIHASSQKGNFLNSNIILPIKQWKCKTRSELECMSIEKLKTMTEELSHIVENVSSELVSLLLENDALQHETDARNVAIEQLLKLTWKQTETELRPIQMSVILPSDDCENSTD